MTAATKVVVSHSHGERRGRKVAQSGRHKRRTCPWVVRIAEADGPMRGSESSESSDEGRRREGHGWKARWIRGAVLFHHKTVAQVLDGPSEALVLGPTDDRDGASEVRCSTVSTERAPAEASATG